MNFLPDDDKRKVWRSVPRYQSDMTYNVSGNGSLVFINDVSVERNSSMSCEVYRFILARFQPNATKLIGQCLNSANEYYPKAYCKSNQRITQGKEIGCSSVVKSVSCCHSNRAKCTNAERLTNKHQMKA